MDVRNTNIMVRPGIATLSAVDHFMIEIVNATADNPARDAVIYHLETGGQRMRAKLALASAHVQLNDADAIAAAAACELLHNASLIHDDISDQDNYRRGQETVRARFGENIALCAGDLLMALSFQAALTITDRNAATALLAALTNCSARVIGGQSIELGYKGGTHEVPLRTYLDATRAKTAPLIELSIGIGLHDSKGQRAKVLGEAIGLAYQILDDLDDLTHIGTHSMKDAHLHPLHAAFHHRDVRQCLRHANSALDRASKLAQTLPSPLDAAVSDLIKRLRDKAAKHVTAPASITAEG